MSLLYILLHVLNISAAYKVVTLSYGPIRGKVVESPRGKAGYAFLGVPIAEPITGPNRFKDGISVSAWTEIKDTLDYISCPQPLFKMRNQQTKMTEDCLQTNVYTSKLCLIHKNCSVMAFVHGGARFFLAPEKTPEEDIINNYANDERKIVFVHLQFRLGVFGWLNLAPQLKTSADSNLCNRDVIFGMKWIQREIAKFGGDPNRVTFAGHSSGAQSVLEIIMAGVIDDIYDQVLLMSTPFWGERNSEANTLWSRKMAQKLSCAAADEKFLSAEAVIKVENCMRTKSWEQLHFVQFDMDNEVEMLEGVWVDGPDGVFPDTFKNLMGRKLPRRKYLMGTLTAEIKTTRSLIDSQGIVHLERLDSLCTAQAYEYHFDHPEEYRKLCNDEYKRVTRAESMNDDQVYYYPAIRFADKFSENGTVYMYSFEYPVKGERYWWNATVQTPRHAEDLRLMMWGNYSNYTEDDFQREKMYSGIIANFVNFGNPMYQNQTWKPWNKERRDYFVIDFDEKLKMPGLRAGYYNQVAAFFENVSKLAGKAHLSQTFPQGIDSFISAEMIYAYTSEWSNKSEFYEKTFSVAIEIKELWEAHVSTLKNSISPSWPFLILVFLAILLICLLCIVFCLQQMKRRRNYESM